MILFRLIRNSVIVDSQVRQLTDQIPKRLGYSDSENVGKRAFYFAGITQW